MIQQKISNLREPVRMLRQIQTRFPDAILAGGAVRDTFFDLLPRDYDIFIQDPGYLNGGDRKYRFTNKQLAQICDLEQKPPKPGVSMSIADDSISKIFAASDPGEFTQYYFCNYVTQIYNVVKNYVPYQLIFVQKPPLDYVNNHFDVGLCKGWCDGHRLRYTKDFMYDAQNKRLSIVGQIQSQAQFNFVIDHHVGKLKEKFPSFTVRIAEHNKKYMVNDSVPPF